MKKIIFTALTLFSFWGCTSLKPDSSHISTADYNKRVEVQNPIYYKQINAVGIGSIVATTAVGAYAGYQSKAMQYNNGSEQKPLDIGNALIGAAVGYTLSYYGNRLLGWGKTTTAPNYKQWLTKANPNYKWLNGGDEDMLRAIHRSAEADFKVQNLSDAQDFAQAFKNSEYTNRVIYQALINKALPRSDFADMASIFSSASDANKLKKEYIVRSRDVSELLEGEKKYPETDRKLIERLMADKLATVSEVAMFKKKYPASVFENVIFDKFSSNLSRGELKNLITLFPKAQNSVKAKKRYYELSENLKAFEDAVTTYPILRFKFPNNYTQYASSEIIASSYVSELSKQVGILSTSFVSKISEEIQRNYLDNRMTGAYNKQWAKNLKENIGSMTWISSKLKNEFETKLGTLIKRYEQKEILAEMKSKYGDVGILAFHDEFSSTEEDIELLPTLEAITQKYITVEDSDIWTAIGNRSWTDGFADSFDGIKTGGKYNIFVVGMLKNDLDYPIKVNVASILHYRNTVSVSVFSSTTERSMRADYYVEVPALGKSPFLVIYKDFNSGGTAGGGFLSAGSVSYLTDDPYTISFSFYPNKISKETKDQQNKLIKAIRKSGNISVNDSEEDKNRRIDTKNRELELKRDIEILKEKGINTVIIRQ